MRTNTTKNSKTRLVSAFAVLLISFCTVLNSNAATVTIKSSTNWSAITTGSGVGGVPTASDDVEISGNGTYVTIDMNAVCRTLKIGKNAPHLMGFIFTGSNNLTVSGAVTGDFGSSNGIRGGSFDFSTNNATGTLTTTGFVGTVVTDTFYLTPGSGTVNVTGTNTLPRTMKNFNNLVLGGATTLATDINVTGNLTINNTLASSTFGVTMNGTAAQAINGNFATTFNNLTIANTTNIVSTAVNISIASGKNLTINAGATFKPGATNTVGGAGTLTGGGTGVVTRSGSDPFTTQYAITNKTLNNLTLDFTGSASQTVTNALTNLKNIIVSNTAGTTFDNNITLSGSLTVNANAIAKVTNGKKITGNTLGGSGKVIVTEVSGTSNFTTQYNFTTRNTSALTIEFAGAAAQSTSYSPYYKLIVNNANGLTLASNLTVNNLLTLTTGNVVLGNYDLTVSGSISGGSASNYIQADGNGRLKSTVANNNVSQLFPVGTAIAYLPVGVKVPSSATSTLFSVGVTNNIVGSTNTTITAHAVKATWNVVPAATVNGMVLTFNWNASQNHPDYDATKSFIVSRANTSTTWQAIDPSSIPNGTDVSGATAPYTQSTPSIPSSNANTGLYSIGDVSAKFGTVVPLPVELVSFNANKIDEAQVRLDWSTAWEVNNRGFEVERSTNGVYWTNVGFVEGHGNSTSILNYTFATPIAGINATMVYYRLKQVDFNGKFEYAPVRTVRLNGATAKVEGIYPNPAMNRISVNLGNVEAGNTAKITILDMTGKVIMVSEQMVEAGSTALDMNIENLKTGNYIVNISSANTSYNTKLIKL